MQIIPGYDFFATETPNRAKLGLMASGMSVIDIALEQINNTLLLVTVTDGTQLSLPAEGWLWVDARNNVWGRTRNGNVIVRKSEGGWESNRYRSGPGGTASVYSIPGEIVQFANFIVADTNESNVAIVVFSGGSATGGTWHVGVNQETVPSTATDGVPFYPRVVYRGQTVLYGPDFTPPVSGDGRMRGWRNTVNSPWWIFTDFDQNESRVCYSESNQKASNQTDYLIGFFFPGLLTA